MTKTETPTRYASALASGDHFELNGRWYTLDYSCATGNGVWLYTTSGEPFWFLAYASLPYAPAGL